MKHKSLILVGLFVIFGLIVTGCGGGTPTPAEEAQAPAPAPGFTPASVCAVPDVVGLDQDAAKGMLTGVGLQPVQSSQYDPSVAEGAVISQDPPAGTRMEPCQGDVTIVISLGPLPTPVLTNTPQPTDTPNPTSTPEPTITPTFTPSPTPQPQSYFNDMTTDGWSINTGSLENPGVGGAGGGENNGFLMTECPSDGKASWYIAPSKFQGDWSDYSYLKFDIWSAGGDYGPSEHIVISSEHMVAHYQLPHRPAEHWETFIVPLNKAEVWTLEAGATSLDDILRKVTDFRIRAEYGDGADRSGLDNVELYKE